jgi:sugar/nucleoside kinase (ribokinase family)
MYRASKKCRSSQPVSHKAAAIAKRHNIPVLIDHAPAQQLSDELLSMVDYIVPNESEIAELTGVKVQIVGRLP